jgi:predicted secreted Zn-dependent protease
VRIGAGILGAALCLGVVPLEASAQSQWQPVEQIQTYSITGDSGVDLYASIGERGPKIGKEVRAIAHTNFKLTWTRDYRPQPDGACTLVSARPKLIITYTLPKPASVLAPDLKKKWDVFIEGVRKHELVHGVIITDMVKEIERVSVGLSVADDPKCAKIRTELTAKLGEISKAQQKRSSDYDRMEMGEGGNVHQLILQLVNGPAR